MKLFNSVLIIAVLFLFSGMASAAAGTIWGYTLEGTRVIIQPNSSLETHSVNIPGFPNEAACLVAKADQEARTFPGTKDARNSIVIPASKTYFVGECYKGKYFSLGL